MSDYMREHRERELARRLFVEHNRSNGAIYPDGFGFLSSADKKPWIEKARELLAAGNGGFIANIQARLAVIDQMIPNAKLKERRALQKERADLEDKLWRSA